MGRWIIFCSSCNAKYDVSRVAPGARFLCKTCRIPVKVPLAGPPDENGLVDAVEEDLPELDVISEDLVINDGSPEEEIKGLSFTKMVGTGNDFILVDGFREIVEDEAETARILCDRRLGVGADGVLLLLPGEEGDVRMRMFNPDGSEAEACGNGLRCLVKYAFDHGHVSGKITVVETLAGLRMAEVHREGGVVTSVRVEMGAPVVDPAGVPVRDTASPFGRVRVEAGGRTFEGAAVSMGNPHFVIFVDDVDAMDLTAVGPAIENNPIFPNRTNVEFVEVVSSSRVRQRTWERGAGETLACGSGACATCVAGRLLSRTGAGVVVQLKGGDLLVDWEKSGEVFLEGPAEELFTGLWCRS